jgi:hypothetical protein
VLGGGSVDPGGGGLTSVSCSSTNFCVAVDGDGNALTYNGAGWSPPRRISPNALELEVAENEIEVENQGRQADLDRPRPGKHSETHRYVGQDQADKAGQTGAQALQDGQGH